MENERPPINSASDYPNASFVNSKPIQPQQKAVARQRQAPVVEKGQVRTKKKSAFMRAKRKFVTGDGNDLMDYAINDVIVPTFKSVFVDIVANAADILMYGEPRHGRPSPGATRITRGGGDYGYHTPYRSISSPRYSSSGVSNRGVISGSTLRDRLALDDFLFATRGAASDVLDRMSTSIDDYGMVSVLNLYDFCDLTCPATYDDYIWTDLSMAAIKPDPDGWILSLPTPHRKG